MDLDLRIEDQEVSQQRLVLSGEHVQRDAKVGVVQAGVEQDVIRPRPLHRQSPQPLLGKPAHGACGGDGVARDGLVGEIDPALGANHLHPPGVLHSIHAGGGAGIRGVMLCPDGAVTLKGADGISQNGEFRGMDGHVGQPPDDKFPA